MARLKPVARLISLIFFVILLEGNGVATAGELPQSGVSHMKLQGEIVDIQSERIVVKTSVARYTLSRKAVPLNAKVGDKVTLSVNHNHAVIDHHSQDTDRRHRFITGTLLYADEARKQIKLWTPEGNAVYPLEEHEVKTRELEEGTMVRVELNESGQVIDLLPVEDEVAFCDKRHHCKVLLEGKVAEIRSGMIFIQTPAVEYELLASVAPRDTEPGDEVTVWVNDDSVVLYPHRKGEGTHHRFITGKLTYAGQTKKEIRLWTPEGEKTFLLEQLEAKATQFQEGRLVTVEVNEVDAVIDLWESS
jgi:Zn ribbon nucleic-acid-binding protein